MRGGLLPVRVMDGQPRAIPAPRPTLSSPLPHPRGGPRNQGERDLPPRHRKVHLCQQLGVEQGPVQVPARVVHTIVPAERVETVLLTRMTLPGERQGVRHRAVALQRLEAHGQLRKLLVQKGDVKGRVVNEELRPGQELEQVVRHVRETWLVRQELVADPVDLEGACFDLTLGVQILMKGAVGHPAIHDLHAPHLDDPVALCGVETGGLGVEDDLSHGCPSQFGD